jgi:oligopeptide transport system substrate-binding protein
MPAKELITKEVGMLRAVLKVILGIGLSIFLAGHVSAEMVYHRGNTAEPETLDPSKASTTYEFHILRDLFEGLVMPDATANVVPGVALHWQVSGDETVYTFKLREDALWSNGDPVTADDFVFAFRRLQDPATASEYASMLYVVKNAEAINTGKMSPDEIGARAIDGRTLEITLNGPTPYFLELLTHPTAYPLHRASVQRLGEAWTKPGNLISNGPFVLTERVPDDHIKIVRNGKFHNAADVKLDAVVFYPTQDRSTAIKRFEAGELDSNDELPLEQIRALKEKFGSQLHIVPYLGVYFLYINLAKEPWNNPQLRRAISMAVDREFLADKVWGGAMFPAYGFVPPGIEGYEPYRPQYVDTPDMDRVDEASRILRTLGYGPDNPLKLELRYDTSENNQNTGIALQEQLRPLGVEVTLHNSDAKTHFGHLDGKGDFDFARGGWIGDYKDPETFLGIARKASGNNLGHYDSPEFEQVMAAAAAAGANTHRRMRHLSQAEKVLVESDGMLPLLFFSSQNIVSGRVKGWQENVMDIHPSRFISVERP